MWSNRFRVPVITQTMQATSQCVAVIRNGWRGHDHLVRSCGLVISIRCYLLQSAHCVREEEMLTSRFDCRSWHRCEIQVDTKNWEVRCPQEHLGTSAPPLLHVLSQEYPLSGSLFTFVSHMCLLIICSYDVLFPKLLEVTTTRKPNTKI
jgi:hypothetical protein